MLIINNRITEEVSGVITMECESKFEGFIDFRLHFFLNYDFVKRSWVETRRDCSIFFSLHEAKEALKNHDDDLVFQKQYVFFITLEGDKIPYNKW